MTPRPVPSLLRLASPGAAGRLHRLSEALRRLAHERSGPPRGLPLPKCGRSAHRTDRRRTVLAGLAISLALGVPAPAPAQPEPPPEGTPSEGPRAESEVSYVWALRALNHGEDGEAVALLRRAVEVDPDHGAARWWLGRTLLRLGEVDAGRRELAASLDAGRPPSLSPELLAETRSQIDDRAPAPGALPGAPATLPGGAFVRGERVVVGHLPRWEARLGGAAATDPKP